MTVPDNNNQRLSVPRLADLIAREIESAILHGAHRAGERLPPERELAVHYGVSRGPVREALKQLAARGLIESRQGGGNYVTRRLSDAFASPWEDLLKRHSDLRSDVLEFRRMLEGEAAALAAERATDAERARLRELFERLETAYQQGKLADQSAADVAFHLALAEASQNVMLSHLVSSLLETLRNNIHDNIASLFDIAPVAEDLLAQHRAIWLAVEAADGEMARAAARAHIDFIASKLDAMRTEARRHALAYRRAEKR